MDLKYPWCLHQIMEARILSAGTEPLSECCSPWPTYGHANTSTNTSSTKESKTSNYMCMYKSFDLGNVDVSHLSYVYGIIIIVKVMSRIGYLSRDMSQMSWVLSDIFDFHSYKVDKTRFIQIVLDVSHHEYLGSCVCCRSETETDQWVMGHPFSVSQAGLWVRGMTRVIWVTRATLQNLLPLYSVSSGYGPGR